MNRRLCAAGAALAMTAGMMAVPAPAYAQDISLVRYRVDNFRIAELEVQLTNTRAGALETVSVTGEALTAGGGVMPLGTSVTTAIGNGGTQNVNAPYVGLSPVANGQQVFTFTFAVEITVVAGSVLQDRTSSSVCNLNGAGNGFCG